MTTENLIRFNHYDFSNVGIDNAINFINWGVVPPGLDARQDAAFQTKFGPHTGFISRVVHGHAELFYNPNPNFNLEVVRPNNTQARIQLIYNDPRQGQGMGLSAFYKAVCLHYLNIKKAQTDLFLSSQGDYQVTRETHRQVNKPIMSSVPNERAGVDLIIMTPYNVPGVNGNGNQVAIFTYIDFFSGKVCARPLSSRNNSAALPALSNALDHIIHNDLGGTYPAIIQADSEFNQGDFAAYCALHLIVLIQTTSYTPWSNGKIERENRELRRKMKRGFAVHNNVNWTHHLQDYVAARNNQIGSRTKLSPNMLWTPGYHPLPPGAGPPHHIPLTDGMTTAQKQIYKRRYEITRAQRMVAVGHDHIYNVGDLVRLSLYKFSNLMRRAKESGIHFNTIGTHFSPIICHVVAVVPPPANNTRRTGYHIADAANNVIMSGPVPKMFFSSEMMPVPVPFVQTGIHPKTVARSVYLNRL